MIKVFDAASISSACVHIYHLKLKAEPLWRHTLEGPHLGTSEFSFMKKNWSIDPLQNLDLTELQKNDLAINNSG